MVVCRALFLVGAPAAGKTTLANAVREADRDLGVLTEVARTLMREQGITREKLEAWLEPSGPERHAYVQFQLDIVERQSAEEEAMLRAGVPFVSDRSAVDALVYCSTYGFSREEVLASPPMQACLARYPEPKVQFVLVHPLNAERSDDGVRLLKNLDSHQFTAEMKALLDQHEIPYIDLTTQDLESRVQQVLALTNVPKRKASVEPATEQRKSRHAMRIKSEE